MVHEKDIFPVSLEVQNGHVTTSGVQLKVVGASIAFTLKRFALLNFFHLIKMFSNTQKN